MANAIEQEKLLRRAVASKDLAKVQEALSNTHSSSSSSSSSSSNIINCEDGILRTPLHWSAANGTLDISTFLLSQGARVDKTDDDNATPLHLAAFYGHTDTVALLLRHHADSAARDRRGWSALHSAADGGLDGASSLLGGCCSKSSSRADKSSGGGASGGSGGDGRGDNNDGECDEKTFESGTAGVVGLLLQHNAAKGLQRLVNATDEEGWTALHVAANRNHHAVVQALLKGGADPQLVTPEGKTAQQLAEEWGHQETVGIFKQWQDA